MRSWSFVISEGPWFAPSNLTNTHAARVITQPRALESALLTPKRYSAGGPTRPNNKRNDMIKTIKKISPPTFDAATKTPKAPTPPRPPKARRFNAVECQLLRNYERSLVENAGMSEEDARDEMLATAQELQERHSGGPWDAPWMNAVEKIEARRHDQSWRVALRQKLARNGLHCEPSH
jgi:hypothetical protein